MKCCANSLIASFFLATVACFVVLIAPSSDLYSTRQVYAAIDDTGIDESTGETASTNPKSRTDTVTATVVDRIPPSIPILVAPLDESLIITTLPTFIWNPSTDEQGIEKYQLYLDGNLLFDNIPTGSTTNGSYSLVVEDGEMKLTVHSPLGQGHHTWQVMAYDINDNSASSATWDFTIDTLAPLTIVTNVGTFTTIIRSDDVGSIPSTPLELEDNNPSIVGTTETGATLQLTLTIPGNPSQVFTLTNSDGTFTFPLGVLPINVVMNFTIVSSDTNGNSSTIANVPFIIQPEVIIIIPPSGEPTPTPLPGETPGPSATPVIEIEVPRPEEVIKELEKAITTPPQRTPYITRVIENLPFLQNQVVETIVKNLPAMALIIPPLIATATALQSSTPFIGWIWELISKLLQAIGLIPKRRPRGLVYDTKTGEPVAFVTINIIALGETQTMDVVVTDTSGVYYSVRLPKGMYRLEALHAQFSFPTRHPRPTFVSATDYYLGENFTVEKDNQELFFIIPIDPKDNNKKEGKRRTLLSNRLYLVVRKISRNLFYPLALFSAFIALVYPTRLNVCIALLYIVQILFLFWLSKRHPFIKGIIKNLHGEIMPNVLIRVSETQSNTLIALALSDANGAFDIRVPPGKYTLTFNKERYVLKTNDGNFDSIYLEHTKKSETLAVTMQTIDEAFPS